MTTTLTPPSVPPVPPTPPEPRAGSRVVATLTIALGVALILGALGTAALGAIGAATRGAGGTLTADATGIRSLNVDVAAADVTVVYGDGAATLDVDGDAAQWRLRRDGDRLVVTTQRNWWSVIRPFGQSDTAVLTLPRALERVPLDATLTLGAGSLRASGTYGTLDVTLSAGAMDLSGRASTFDADVSAGRLVVDLAGVDTAGLKLSAGEVEGALTGTAPRSVTANLSAGRLALVLPDTTYAVSTSASAGTVENRLRVDPASPHRITIGLSAGYASLRS